MTDVRDLPAAVADVRDRHLDFYLDLARRGQAGLDEEDNTSWVDLLRSEQDNFRSALTWAVESGRTGDGLELAWSLLESWGYMHATAEARRWLERLLASNGAPPGPRGKGNLGLATVLWSFGEYAEAARKAGEAVDLLRQAEDEDLAGYALGWQAWALWYDGKINECGPLFEESIAILRRSQHADWLEHSVRGLGWYRLSLGDHASALKLHEEGGRIFRQTGNRRWLAGQLSVHANIYRNIGDRAKALELLEESLVLARELAEPDEAIWAAINLAGELLDTPGRMDAAEKLLADQLPVARAHEDTEFLAETLEGLATVAKLRGDRGSARTLLQEAMDHAHRIRDETRSVWPRERLHQAIALLDLVEGRRDEARRNFDAVVALQRKKLSDAWLGGPLSHVARLLADIAPDRAQQLREEASSLFVDLEDERLRPLALMANSDLVRSLHGPEEALGTAREALELAMSNFSGDRVAPPYLAVGELLYESGDHATLRTELEDGLAYAADSVRWSTGMRELLSAACAGVGDIAAAERHLTELWDSRHALTSPRQRCRLLETAAKIAAARERWPDSARLLGAAESYRQLVGAQRYTHELASFSRCVDSVSSALGERDFTAAFEEGQRHGGLAAFDQDLV